MKQYIDKTAIAAEIEKRIKETESMQPKFDQFWAGQISAFKGILKIIDILEVKELIAEQECTCNEALNRIIGSSWNLLCPVNKLGLKTGDKVKVIIKAQKGK